MKRFYESIIEDHFLHYDKMLFLAGPRQVGKTTIAKKLKICLKILSI
jgi:predicted AAA+ superfamily ATPase